MLTAVYGGKGYLAFHALLEHPSVLSCPHAALQLPAALPHCHPQEPAIYRLYEALCHSGDALKTLMNEECGDGIMSAIGEHAEGGGRLAAGHESWRALRASSQSSHCA